MDSRVIRVTFPITEHFYSSTKIKFKLRYQFVVRNSLVLFGW